MTLGVAQHGHDPNLGQRVGHFYHCHFQSHVLSEQVLPFARNDPRTAKQAHYQHEDRKKAREACVRLVERGQSQRPRHAVMHLPRQGECEAEDLCVLSRNPGLEYEAGDS